MVSKQVFQQFQSILGLELLLQHSIEDKVKNGQHSGDFLIAVLVLLAEDVVHIVEVKLKQFDFVGRFVWRYIDDGLQVEDLCEYASFTCICTSLLQALGLILIEFSVEEETLLGILGCSRRDTVILRSLSLLVFITALCLATKAWSFSTTHIVHLIRSSLLLTVSYTHLTLPTICSV